MNDNLRWQSGYEIEDETPGGDPKYNFAFDGPAPKRMSGGQVLLLLAIGAWVVVIGIAGLIIAVANWVG